MSRRLRLECLLIFCASYLVFAWTNVKFTRVNCIGCKKVLSQLRTSTGHYRQNLVQVCASSAHDEHVGYSGSDSCSNSLYSPSHSRRGWFHRVAWTLATAPSVAFLGPPPTSAIPALVTTAAVCDPTVTVWRYQGEGQDRVVYLLGTAHISEVSAKLASQLVEDVVPNAVFVELDLKRISGPGATAVKLAKIVPSEGAAANQEEGDTAISSLENVATGEQPKTRPVDIIVPRLASPTTAAGDEDGASLIAKNDADDEPQKKRGLFGGAFDLRQRALGFGTVVVGNALRGMYKNLGDAGFQPGEEFVAAIQAGQAVGSSIVLGDQDVEYTLKRLTQALAVTDLNKLLDPDSELERSMNELMGKDGGVPNPLAGPSRDDVTSFRNEMSAFVENMKSRERVAMIMSQLREIAPALVQVMLTERDAYMAAGLGSLNQFESIVAVMGLAHMDGVERNLKDMGWQQVKLDCK